MGIKYAILGEIELLIVFFIIPLYSVNLMNKKIKNTILSRLALLLLVVFVGSLLVKPAHSLLAHHQHSEGICASEHDQTVSTNHYKDCAICDFEFCTFIQQKQISIPQATIIVRKEQTHPTIACLADISTHLFRLRAPPAQ
jgi:hypothetical protein